MHTEVAQGLLKNSPARKVSDLCVILLIEKEKGDKITKTLIKPRWSVLGVISYELQLTLTSSVQVNLLLPSITWPVVSNLWLKVWSMMEEVM